MTPGFRESLNSREDDYEHDEPGAIGYGGGCTRSCGICRSIDRSVSGLYTRLQPTLVQGIPEQSGRWAAKKLCRVTPSVVKINKEETACGM